MSQLQIKLADIPPSGYALDLTLPREWVAEQIAGGVPRYTAEDGAVVHARLERVGADVRVSGSVATRVATECSRCLDPVAVSLEETYRALVVRGDPAVDTALAVAADGPYGAADEATDDATIQRWIAEAERQAAGADEESDVYHFDGVTVDLTELVRAAIALALPMVPHCRPDCRGLCQKCGAKLNEAACGCEPDRPLSPFAVLASFKKKN